MRLAEQVCPTDPNAPKPKRLPPWKKRQGQKQDSDNDGLDDDQDTDSDDGDFGCAWSEDGFDENGGPDEGEYNWEFDATSSGALGLARCETGSATIINILCGMQLDDLDRTVDLWDGLAPDQRAMFVNMGAQMTLATGFKISPAASLTIPCLSSGRQAQARRRS